MSIELWKAICDWAAVVLVGLTFIAGAGALITGRILSGRQDAKLRQFSTELAGAKSALATQQERAAIAEGKIALAEQHTAEALRDIAKAKELAEKEKLARVKIEASVAWRRLTDKQKIEIPKRLHEYPPEAISIWFFAGDAEGQRFASDIAEVLREGKMYVYPPRPLSPPGPQTASVTDPITPYETGVQVASTNEPPSRLLADAIAKELRSAGFDAKIVQSDAPDAMAKSIGLPNIVVGVVGRPNGPQGEYKLQSETETTTKDEK